MSTYYTDANLHHTLASIAPRSRGVYLQVEFEVFGNIHGEFRRVKNNINQTNANANYRIWRKPNHKGLNFTKYAKEMSKQLGINGWIRYNHKRGSVIGQIEGEKEKVDQMSSWLKLQAIVFDWVLLKTTGAPGSRIEQCNFRGWQIVDTRSFRDFSIRF